MKSLKLVSLFCIPLFLQNPVWCPAQTKGSLNICRRNGWMNMWLHFNHSLSALHGGACRPLWDHTEYAECLFNMSIPWLLDFTMLTPEENLNNYPLTLQIRKLRPGQSSALFKAPQRWPLGLTLKLKPSLLVLFFLPSTHCLSRFLNFKKY